MKKLFLLLAAGSIAMNVGAQERQGLMNPGPKTMNNKVPYYDADAAHRAHLRGGAHKTTGPVPTDRWYSYADWLRTDAQFNATYGYAGDSLATTLPYMWNDDKSRSMYSSGLDTNQFVSYGVVLHPQWAGFNNGKYYPIDEMTLPASEPFTVDSLEIVGAYLRSPAKYSIKDTLIVSIVHSAYGAKGTTDVWSQSVNTTHYGTITFPNVSYDSIYNHGTGTTVSTMKIVMNVATDTAPNGAYLKVIDLSNTAAYGGTGVVSCAAGDLVGWTVSFKSGDPSYVAYDTVFRGSPFVPVVKYNMFRPYLDYTTNGGTSTQWPTYASTNRNDGLFKTLPDTTNGWGKRYIPTFAWGVSSPGDLQAPRLYTHIKCPTCTVGVTNTYLSTNSLVNISEVTATPNPASNLLNISFTLAQAANVNVSLTNVVGQVVATQNINSTSNGKATFNTAALPSGVYVYTLQANGEKSTGRVVIAH